MIHIDKLSKSFGEKVLFSEFCLDIPTGEFLVFSGGSGCGKTTLLNMIGALENIDSGEIVVDGIDISIRKNQLDYFGTKVGFIFQNYALLEHKTVFENLRLIKKRNQSGVSAAEALTKVGLEGHLKSMVYTLSGGEQQRVALARLMIKKCDIVLADEPTGSLDRKNAHEVLEILKQFNAEGKTVIIVTHDDEIKKMGRMVIEL
jgi:putative ABC transport system ATP-binding protein